MSDIQSLLFQKVFPAWADQLGLRADDLARRYRELEEEDGHRTVKLTELDRRILGIVASNGDASISTYTSCA